MDHSYKDSNEASRSKCEFREILFIKAGGTGGWKKYRSEEGKFSLEYTEIKVNIHMQMFNRYSKQRGSSRI